MPAARAAVSPLLPFLAVIASGLFAWWGVWNHEFVFDDNPAIRENAPLLAGDWWQAAFQPPHHPLSNRPFACLTLALDFAVFGVGPFGPHLTNLLLHLLNGCLLLALMRRVLRAPNLAARVPHGAVTPVALAVASLWTVHALGTDTVAYATQRSTLLASGLLLACLYATLRAHGSPRRLQWQGAAVAAMALGMGSKEDLVVGPLLVVLFERAFVLPSWAPLRARLGFHLALAATWAVLAACVAAGPRNPTVGFATTPRLGAFEWLATQAGVIVHYVALAFWPQGLRGAYDWDYVRTLGPAVLPGLAVLALLAGTVWAWRSRPWWGWLSALFFLWLAPTSTVMPIATEILAERRMYLPMLAAIVPVVVGGWHLLAGAGPRAFAVAAAVLVLGAAAVTRSHVPSYANEQAFWAAAFAHADLANRGHLASQIFSNHGAMLYNQGRFDEAHRLFDAAIACEAPTREERVHWAVSMLQRGRAADGLAELERLVAAFPDYAEANGSLGTALLGVCTQEDNLAPGDARLLRAETLLQRATAAAPWRNSFWNSLGVVHKLRGNWAGAEACAARAAALSSDRIEPFLLRAEALARLGRTAEIDPMFAALLSARPTDLPLRLDLAARAARAQDWPRATTFLREVLRIDPRHQQAATALREIEARTPR